MSKYVTAETVSPGHPDKIADLISDYVLTKALENNKQSRVAVETFLTGTEKGGLVVVGGEISEIANITDEAVVSIVKEALEKTIKTSFPDFDLDNLTIQNELTPQSEEIRAAVDIAGISDTVIQSLADNHFLYYDYNAVSDTGFWKNRLLVASDIPTIDISSKTTGTLPVNRGGTGATSGYNSSNWNTA